MRFDHLLHWVPDLQAAAADYAAIGLRVRPGGRHPTLGTENAICPLEGAYVELITLREPDVTARSVVASWVQASRPLLRAGGGALPFGIRTTALRTELARLQGVGIAKVAVDTASIERPDGSTATWRMAVIPDGPRWTPFLIDYGLPEEQAVARYGGLHGPLQQRITIETPDVGASADWLSRILGLQPTAQSGGGVLLGLDNCAISLVAGPAQAIVQVALAGPDAPSGQIRGLRFVRA